MLNDLYQIIIHLNTLIHPLRQLLQKEVDFDWTETCNRAFKKLNSIWNSVNCFSYFHKSIYRIVHTDARPFV